MCNVNSKTSRLLWIWNIGVPSKHIDIADGTVYPILRKLKSDGLVTTYLSEDSGGPPRKYYSLTALGFETYEADKKEYLNFAEIVETLLEDEDYDKKWISAAAEEWAEKK